MIGKLITAALLVAVVAVVVSMLPDVQRYRKMRAM
jgi:hypothetical protein